MFAQCPSEYLKPLILGGNARVIFGARPDRFAFTCRAKNRMLSSVIFFASFQCPRWGFVLVLAFFWFFGVCGSFARSVDRLENRVVLGNFFVVVRYRNFHLLLAYALMAMSLYESRRK